MSERDLTTEKGRPTVLLVDDDPLVLSALARVLSRAGCIVTIAHDGQHALDQLAQKRVDVVVSDINMPNLDGVRLLKEVRVHDPDLPVLLLTGRPTLNSAVTAVELGAHRYLMKPVPPDDLVAAVNKAWQIRRLAQLKAEAFAVYRQEALGASSRAQLAQAFDRALSSMRLIYQPIVDLKARQTFAHEALLRTWERALPNPGALREAAGLLNRWIDLGRAMRARVASTLVEHPSATVFLDLTAVDLDDDELVKGQSPLSPVASRTVLEITERESFDRVRDAGPRIAALRAQGFRIAVADLGGGGSGLTGFAIMQPDIVKLESALVRGIDASAAKKKIVTAIGWLAAEMGVRLVAGGVTTAAERDALVEVGCDYLQGNLFAEPGPPFPEPVW